MKDFIKHLMILRENIPYLIFGELWGFVITRKKYRTKWILGMFYGMKNTKEIF